MSTPSFRLYVESDGDRKPKDVYICAADEGTRVATMEGHDENAMFKLARYIVRSVNCHDELVAALEYASELIKTGRQYFPKSIRDRDKFNLENTNAAIGKALAKAKGEP